MLVYCPWMILVVFDQNFEIDGKNCTFGLELLICDFDFDLESRALLFISTL